jgi:hypothetical protein
MSPACPPVDRCVEIRTGLTLSCRVGQLLWDAISKDATQNNEVIMLLGVTIRHDPHCQISQQSEDFQPCERACQLR